MAGKGFLPLWVFLYVTRYIYICMYIYYLFLTSDFLVCIHFVLEFPYKCILISQTMFCLWKTMIPGLQRNWKSSPRCIENLLWNNLSTTSQERVIGRWKLAMEQSHFIYFFLNIIGWHEFWSTSCSDISSIVLLIIFSNYKVMIV